MGKRRRPVSSNLVDHAQILLFEETASRYQEKARLSQDPEERAGFAMIARKYLFFVIDENSARAGLKAK